MTPCRDCKHYDPRIYHHEARCLFLRQRCSDARSSLGQCKREAKLFAAGWVCKCGVENFPTAKACEECGRLRP